MSRLLVAVLGNRDSGKSHTWNLLFGQVVRTGRHPRDLPLGGGQCTTVFLVSGSPEERETEIAQILLDQTPEIVLCSVQYAVSAQQTFQFFVDNGYSLAVHWLNPGYSDSGHQPDTLGLVEWLRHQPSLIGIRDGQDNAQARVVELRCVIHGWAAQKGIIHPCP